MDEANVWDPGMLGVQPRHGETHVCFTPSTLSPQPCSRQRELEKTRLRLPQLGWHFSAGGVQASPSHGWQ